MSNCGSFLIVMANNNDEIQEKKMLKSTNKNLKFTLEIIVSWDYVPELYLENVLEQLQQCGEAEITNIEVVDDNSGE